MRSSLIARLRTSFSGWLISYDPYGIAKWYVCMETLISAIQKLVIKDVVLYADRKIEATKNVIDKSSKSNSI